MATDASRESHAVTLTCLRVVAMHRGSDGARRHPSCALAVSDLGNGSVGYTGAQARPIRALFGVGTFRAGVCVIVVRCGAGARFRVWREK